MPTLTTERLVLRPWEPNDLDVASAWHADPQVMKHLGGVMDREGSDATIGRWTAELDGRGYGMLALCRLGCPDPIGAVGLGQPEFAAHFTPCVEIGWRLAKKAWGHGYATEAAREVLRDGFERLRLREILAFAAKTNTDSQRVMTRLGMRRDLDGDFTRPLPAAGGLSMSVLWRIRGADLGREGST